MKVRAPKIIKSYIREAGSVSAVYVYIYKSDDRLGCYSDSGFCSGCAISLVNTVTDNHSPIYWVSRPEAGARFLETNLVLHSIISLVGWL